MNTDSNRAVPALSHAEIDRVLARARAERAETMRAGVGEVVVLLKRYFAGFRSQPSRKDAVA